MFEGSMKSFGWGYVGSNVKGFEWLFDVFKSEASAIRDGKSWMKQAGRLGTISAVKPTPRHFEY